MLWKVLSMEVPRQKNMVILLGTVRAHYHLLCVPELLSLGQRLQPLAATPRIILQGRDQGLVTQRARGNRPETLGLSLALLFSFLRCE